MQTLLKQSPLIAVITIQQVSHAVQIAEALLKGGIRNLEIVLRTPAALPSIQEITTAFPEAHVGAGTILSPQQVEASQKAGAKFLVSPGTSHPVIAEAQQAGLPILPGISTVSEIMQVLEHDINLMKFFPAAYSGGTNALKAFGSVFPDVKFCPTGGITLDTLPQYLNLPNVLAVGGSWLAPSKLAEKEDWQAICELAKQSVAKLQ